MGLIVFFKKWIYFVCKKEFLGDSCFALKRKNKLAEAFIVLGKKIKDLSGWAKFVSRRCRILKKTFIVLMLISLVFYFSGCAAIFKGSNSKLNLSSDPEGAKVYVNGNYYGTTPIRILLKSNQTYTIEFKKEGYKTVARNITNHVGAGWVILDVLGGLVPVIIDAATGSWYELDQKNINALLEKQQP